MAIFEAKMDSLPEDAFEHPPPEDEPEGLDADFGAANGGLAMTDTIAKRQLMHTENALQVAGANPKV